MEIKIQGQNVKVRENLEEYIGGKLQRLERYLPGISNVSIEVGKQEAHSGEIVSAQITLRHSRGAILRAEERARGGDYDALKSVVDLALDKLYRQIERFKGKKSRKGLERFSAYIATQEELQEAEELPETDTHYNDDQEIVRRKSIPAEPMTELEAIDQMELLGHPFFMFYNKQTNSVNVLYRREIGGYGVLVPDAK